MPVFRTIDYLMLGVPLPTTTPQLVSSEKSPVTQVAQSGKQRIDEDSDSSSGTSASVVSCEQQLARQMESAEGSSLIGKSPMVKQDEDLQEDHSRPGPSILKMSTWALSMDEKPEQDRHLWDNDRTPKMSMPTWTCNDTLEMRSNHKDVDEDTIAPSPHGSERSVDTRASSPWSPAQLCVPPGLELHVLSSPVLSHVPRSIAPPLAPTSMSPPPPMLPTHSSGDGVMSVGSVGHPFTCAQPCKWRTKSKKGCKESEACPFCHFCKWKRSSRKNAASRADLS
mmetsp:Transcript_107257/g.268875  ORF Transcript_107257/g.268875 Transcript_107257/m.268875 type:complete len:281 (-) Transcript_107257:158-1000(-)